MPRPTEGVTKKTTYQAARELISKTVEMLIKEGYEQKKAAAIAYKDVREKASNAVASKFAR